MAHLLGEDHFWAAYAHCYDRLWDNALTDHLVDAVATQITGATRVLEVGAGTGLVTSRLLERGFEVVACEPDPAMRRRLCRRCPGATITAHRIEDLDRVGLDGSHGIDAVIAANVLHLVPDPVAAVEVLRALVAPARRLVVATPAPTASVGRAISSLRSCGVPRHEVMRFAAMQASLVPVIGLLGPRRGADRPIGPALATGVRVAEIAGINEIHVFAGTRVPVPS